MKLCFSTLGCPELSAAQVNEAAREYGFSGVEIRALEGTSNLAGLDSLSPAAIDRTRRALTQGGVEVVSVNSGAQLCASSQEERERHAAECRAYIDIASALGARYVRVFGGEIGTGGLEDACRAAAEAARPLAAYAARRGVSLTLETHDDFSPGSRCAQLLEMLPAGALAILWDVLHTCRWGETPGETWQWVSSAVRHVHLKDSASYSSKGFDLTLQGDGALPVRAAVELLRAKGYDGYLSLEWEKLWHPELPDYTVAFPRFVQVMKEYGIA